MDLSNEQIRECSRRLMLSRMRLLCDHGFYGSLLMHMKIHLSEDFPHGATDGKRNIWINPEFLERISDKELDYLLMHEIGHVALRHCQRGAYLVRNAQDLARQNIAADIIVNSNILLAAGGDTSAITLEGAVDRHTAPDGREGHLFTLEELFDLLPAAANPTPSPENGWDDHSMLGQGNGDDASDRFDNETWQGRVEAAAASAQKREEIIDEGLRHLGEEKAVELRIKNRSQGCGPVPAFAEAFIRKLRKPQTDWRTVLDEFIQEEITDYSFAPPDRRFEDSPFFLPDFNEKENFAKDILFMVDTSGSMSDDAVEEVYSEVRGALDQFNGKLTGWLGFFDAAVIPPVRFDTEEEFETIRAAGRGGTSFQAIFDYLTDHQGELDPASIIILTDGYAPFPEEDAAMGIPVLWVINNEEVDPPWGKVLRIIPQ